MAGGVAPAAARARVSAGVTVAVAGHLGVRLPPLALLERWGSPAAVDVAPADATPGLPGVIHEALHDGASRRRGGTFYTPPDVAATVVGWVLEGQGERPVVCDPAVGGGAFLLAAAEALARAGRPPGEVVASCLVGADVDPVAAAVTEAVLALWCGGSAVPRVVVGDALTLAPSQWPVRPDVVVGNPPFLNQLARATARRADEVVALRRRLGPAVSAYTDTAVLFLLVGVRLVRPGGAVAMILPESFLATRDARSVRSAVLAEARLDALWVPSAPVFPAAAVRVCVPVLRREPVSGAAGGTRLWREMPPRLVGEAEVRTNEPTWSHLLAGELGIPEVELAGAATLGEWCEVSADFRQQYYGLAPFVVDDVAAELDDERFPPLVTVGVVDPAASRWGQRATRYRRRRWERPRVDLARLEAESELGPWARSRLVPKVVVATQTRVVEAAVDSTGRWLPSVPLISVTAPVERLWHAAAALSSPAVTAWALRRWAGVALSSDGLKLSAAQVREVPSPPPGADWDEAAAAMRRASKAPDETGRRHWLLAAGAASCRAYGVDDATVVSWWQARLPGGG